MPLDETCNDWDFDGVTASGVYDIVIDRTKCVGNSRTYRQKFIVRGNQGGEGARGLFYLTRDFEGVQETISFPITVGNYTEPDSNNGGGGLGGGLGGGFGGPGSLSECDSDDLANIHDFAAQYENEYTPENSIESYKVCKTQIVAGTFYWLSFLMDDDTYTHVKYL